MLLYMRTVITLDDRLHRRAKAYAARHGTTLAALVEEALRVRLAAVDGARQALTDLPTFKGDGLQPGISLDDASSIYDRMDDVR